MAARVSLPQRKARARGFFLIRAIESALPTISPDCGPPISLSPLKQATSTPAATLARTSGSVASP